MPFCLLVSHWTQTVHPQPPPWADCFALDTASPGFRLSDCFHTDRPSLPYLFCHLLNDTYTMASAYIFKSHSPAPPVGGGIPSTDGIHYPTSVFWVYLKGLFPGGHDWTVDLLTFNLLLLLEDYILKSITRKTGANHAGRILILLCFFHICQKRLEMILSCRIEEHYFEDDSQRQSAVQPCVHVYHTAGCCSRSTGLQ